ncbi:hypothetical protein MBLNU230_g8477t1 [Neophaeotheca triangularis]
MVHRAMQSQHSRLDMTYIAMASNIDNSTLRNSHPKDIAVYLGTTLASTETKTVSEHLIASVACGAISPRVFLIWLSVRKDPLALAQALQQDVSIAARSHAMRIFAKRLRGAKFTETWQAVGGTEGMLELFAKLSLADVRYFCKKMGGCYSAPNPEDTLWQVMTEFTSSLAYKYFPGAKHQHRDRRPLLKYYAHLLPACTASFLKEWIDRFGFPSQASKKLLLSHWLYFQLSFHGLSHHDANEKIPPSDGAKILDPLLHSTPPLPTEKRYLSKSMEFAMERIEAASSEVDVEDEERSSRVVPLEFKSHFAEPLLHRAIRRKAPTAVKCHMLEFIIRYLEARPHFAKTFGLRNDSLLKITIKLWSRRSEVYGELLVRLLQIFQKDDIDGLSRTFSVLELARPALRYELLSMICRHVKFLDLDIENDAEVKQSKAEIWDASIFESLPPEQALPLLRRFMRIRPQCDFLGSSSDSTDLYLRVSRGEEGHKDLSKQKIKKRKDTAVKARDQKLRAVGAKQSIHTAAASGYPDLLAETLLWARRFNRDSWTLQGIYSHSIISHDSVVEVLCGIPERCDPEATPQSISEAIVAGNETIKLLYETMRLCQSEPSFALEHWYGVQELLGTTIHKRELRISKMQASLALTDEETYDIVWRPTLETWMELEAMVLRVENEKLYQAVPQGIVDILNVGPCIPATLRFIDKVARCRDELWRSYRRSLYPAVVSLNEPWPKGLPLQALHPFCHQGKRYDMDMIATPYCLEQATRVVFMPRETAAASLPTDEETRKAIGCVVDDFKMALKVYCTGLDDKPTARLRRTQAAWDHALSQLTGDRMHRHEAVHFWKNAFKEANVDIKNIDLYLPKRPRPALPTIEDADERIEWNPEPDHPLQLPTRNLETVTIDCFLERGRTDDLTPLAEHDFDDSPMITTAGAPRKSFWEPEPKDGPAVCEALIASGMLYLASKKAQGSSLFSKPFPSQDEVRFPAMFLDDAFLQQRDSEEKRAFRYLKERLVDVPPKLLAELVQALFQPLSDKGTAVSSDHTPFLLLKLLATSDRPEMACKFIQHLVVDRPKDSSWHRQFLNSGFFTKLSADQAQEFLHGIVDVLQDRLKASADRDKAMKGGEIASTSSEPVVKTTTVKMLAQIMRHADFFDQHANVSLLGGLFVHSSHIDIQVAVAESLLSTLAKTDDAELMERIFVELEQHAVPVAGRLDERVELTEQDWQDAETSMQLPDIGETYCERGMDERPMMLLLRKAKLQEQDMQQKYDRLIVPAIEASTHDMMRYLAIFLRKQAPHVSIDSLPRTPTRPTFLPEIIQSGIAYLPSHILNTHATLLNIYLSPPPALASLTAQIKNNHGLKTSPGGATWLLFYNTLDNPTLMTNDPFHLNKYLTHPFTSKRHDNNGITHTQIATHASNQLNLLPTLPGNTLPLWTTWLNTLARRPGRPGSEQTLYSTHITPLLQKTIQEVTTLSTSPSYHQTPSQDRVPLVLPDLFKARLWLLSWPESPLEPGWEERCRVFAEEIRIILAGLLAGRYGRLWLRHFAALVEMLKRLESAILPVVAVGVGALEEVGVGGDEMLKLVEREVLPVVVVGARTVAGAGEDAGLGSGSVSGGGGGGEDLNLTVLRVELAAEMLAGAKWLNWSLEARCKVWGMQASWRQSRVAEIRLLGFEKRGSP